MKFVYNDGGRAEAGYIGDTRDCVCRAIAIAAQRPYKEVYDLINKYAKNERITKRNPKRSNARTGRRKETAQKILEHYGFTWVATMHIGQGCTVHLRENELPKGRIVCNLSGHFAAVIDGVLHDTYDCTRDGSRCVYGYYINTDAARDEQESKNKAAFVRKNLAPMLRAAGVDVADVVYRKDPETREEIVTLTYTCGATRDICVTADSPIMIAYEIVKSIYWGEQ